MRTSIRLLSLALLVPIAAAAQSGEWGSRGIARHFVLQNNLLYVADGRGVAVYDTVAMKRLAAAETPSESLDVATLSDNAIVVTTRNSLERFAVGSDGRLSLQSSTPIPAVQRIASSPGGLVAGVTPSGVLLWRPEGESFSQTQGYAVQGTVNALAMRGNALFVAVDGQGISVYDVTGAHDTATIPDDAKDFVISGDKLFIASGVNGLVIVDVADPWSPRVVSRIGSGEMNAQRIAVDGGRVAIGELPDTIDFIDASLVDAPRRTSTVKEPVQTMVMSATRLFVSGSNVDQFGLTTETGIPLRAYDVSNLTAPRVSAEVHDLAGPVTGVATDGSLAYVIDRPLLRVLDISKTSAPREIASLAINNIGDRVRLHGNQVVIYGRGDVQLVDVSNPYQPRFINVFHSNGRPPSNAAFTRNGIIEGNPWTGFHVVDFSYPTPAITASIKSHYYDITSNGDDAAYVGAEARTVTTVDVGTPFAATERNQIPIGIVEAEVAPSSDNHPSLLVVRARDATHVFSLADRFAPQPLSSTAMETSGAFAAAADAAYIATGNGIISIMDLANPTSPVVSPSKMISVAPMQVAVANGKIVVADRYSLRIYGADTVAPPPPPTPVVPPPARRRAASH